MSGLLSWMKDRVQRDARHYHFAAIPGNQVQGGPGSPQALRPEASYLRIWLAEMFLQHDRAWFIDWHPGVHSTVRIQAGNQQQEYPGFVHPLPIPAAGRQLGAVVSLNHILTPLVPFRGGTIEILAGLVGIKGGDHLAGFMKVLGAFANLAGPQAAAGAEVASEVADGIRELLAPAGDQVHLGVHQTFTGGGDPAQRLPAGYLATIQAPAGTIPAEQLWVRDGRLYFGRELAGSAPYSAHTYMLFRVEVSDKRDDWQELASINQPYQAAVAAHYNNQPEDFEVHARLAQAAARLSRDLTKADRIIACQALKEEFQEKRDEGLGATGGPERTLQDVIDDRAFPVDEALAAGEPPLSEALS